MKSKQIKARSRYQDSINNKVVEIKEYNDLQQDVSDLSDRVIQFSDLTAQQQADMRDQIRGYKVYSAKISQSGSENPSAIVLENTIGVVSWERIAQGTYSCYIPGSVSLNYDNIIVILPGGYTNITPIYQIFDNHLIAYMIRDHMVDEEFVGYEIQIITDGGEGLSDGKMTKMPFEIRVYP